jgi:superfamily I DNA and/or RNA helicase
VLACAHSNQATDNLLVGTSSIGHPDPDSLHAAASNEQSDINIARAGNNTSSQVVKQEYFNVPAGSANVVGATMSAAAKFEPDSFDVAIIDEASQASIPATLIPVQAASKVVLAGDHKQLPPYASDELDENEMEISLFEHFIERYGEQVATLLKRQYRMHEQIAAFSSREFYNGALETADQNREWTIGEHPPVEAIHVEGSEARASGHSYRNESEAELVAEHVE